MTPAPARGFLLCALLFLATLAALLSCRPSLPSPQVEYSGCGSFYSSPEPVCTLWPGDTSLNLWVKAEPGNRVEIRIDGKPARLPGKVVGPGLRYVVVPSANASFLDVTVYSKIASRDGATWRLRLAKPDSPKWLAGLKNLNPGDLRRRLEDLRRSAPCKEQALVLGKLAELKGTPTEKEKILQQKLLLERAQHRWSGEVATATWLAYLFVEQGQFGEAARLLQAIHVPPNAPANDKFHVIYSLGDLAAKTGNYSDALKRFQSAAELANRVGMTNLNRDAGQLLALLYQQLGRSQESSTLFAKLLAELDPKKVRPCGLESFLTNLGWFQLMEHEKGTPADNPVPALENALAGFQKNGCPQSQVLNAHLNLALAYQQQGQWPGATRELAQVQVLGEDMTLPELLWRDDLAARAALHEGNSKLALSLYEQLEKRSGSAASPAGLLQAELGKANAYLAGGQGQAAIGALAQADVLIDEQSRHIPVHQGRDTYFAYQEAATRLYLKLLLEADQRQNAFELARKSRSRLLRQLAVRDRLSQLDEVKQKAWLDSVSKYRATRDAVDNDAAKRWQLALSEKERALQTEAEKLSGAQDDLDLALRDRDALRGNREGELAPPAHGEVILAYHPLSERKWVAFAATEQGIERAYFELPETMPSPEELARLLLEPSQPFQAAIANAKSVRLLPYGPLRTVDFHALPFLGGQPLLTTRLVSYSLDLPRRSASPPLSGRPMALVVSNPTRDLRTADSEAQTVAAAIRRWPGAWELKPLKGGAAKAAEVRDRLTRASFFHYAGHGNFGGFAGWSSELPLASHARLTLSDILALSHTPDSVVLSACDAGRTSAEAPGEGVGLANAFLLAGSKNVVASRQSVPDASANELMAEMYRHWQPGEDLPHQLRRAQLTCSKMHPSPCASWASFRLLVP